MPPIKHHLLGVLELSLFMKRGIDRFENNRAAMWRSFIWPAVLFPVTLLGVFMAQRPEIAGLSPFQIVGLYAARSVVGMSLFYAFFSKSAEYLGKGDLFPRFMTAVNWLSIAGAVTFIPTLVALAGHQEWMATYGLLIVFGIYGHLVLGYTAVRALNLPWELGGMVFAINLGISEMTLTMLFDVAAWIRG